MLLLQMEEGETAASLVTFVLIRTKDDEEVQRGSQSLEGHARTEEEILPASGQGITRHDINSASSF